MTYVTHTELAGIGGGGGAEMVGFAQSDASAVARNAADKFLEEFVSIADFYDSGDGGDYALALGRIIDAGYTRIFFPDKIEGYAFETTVSGTLIRDTIIDFNGQRLIFATGCRINLTADNRVPTTISGAISRGTRQIDVTLADDIQAGDIVAIYSSVAPAVSYEDKKHDILRMKSKSGNSLTLEAGTNFAWSTTENGGTAPSVTFYVPVRLHLLNPDLFLDVAEGSEDPAGEYMIRCTGFADLMVRSPKVSGRLPFNPSSNISRSGIQLYHCLGGRIENGTYFAMSYPGGIAGGSRDFLEIGSQARNCRHGHFEVGGWSSDTTFIGLAAQDCHSAVSAHPSFRTTWLACRSTNDATIPAPRSVGWYIGGGCRFHSRGTDSSQPGYDPGAMTSGYANLYDDADYTLDGVELVNDRTANDIRISYGRTARISNTRCVGITLGDGSPIAQFVNGDGNSFSGRPSPSRAGINAGQARSSVQQLPAYLSDSKYHIDPYLMMVDQPAIHLRCSGLIARKLSNGTHVLRVHLRPFVSGTALLVNAKLTIRDAMLHTNPGLTSIIEKDFEIGADFSGSTYLVVINGDTRGPYSGAGGGAVTMSIGSPTLGAAADGYVDIPVVLGTSGAAANAIHQLSYVLVVDEGTL